MAALDRLLGRTGDAPAPVVAISGAGGIGKTRLAVRWAHLRRSRFPDGQLFVDLRGYNTTGEAVDPHDALAGFLEALGVPRSTLPARPDDRTALYRTLLAERRVLVLLDNARDVAQTLPLLPGAGRCGVLVTSRNTLTGLISQRGAAPLPLGVLDDPQAEQLLVQRLGAQRAAAEPDAVRRIISVCGGLPLALGIAAARAAVQPALPLAVVAEELSDHSTRLDTLDADHPEADLRTVLFASTRALPPRPARVFALLGCVPGGDLGTRTVAALAGSDDPAARSDLLALDRHALLQRTDRDRWRMHDLVRDYAGEQAAKLDEAERRSALDAVVGYFVRTAHEAELQTVGWWRPPVTLNLGDYPDTGPSPVDDPDSAQKWLGEEVDYLLQLQSTAADAGWDTAVWHLTVLLQDVLGRDVRIASRVAVLAAGVEAVQRCGTAGEQSYAHRMYGNALSQLGRHDEAAKQLSAALDTARVAGDPFHESAAHTYAASARDLAGDDEGALEHAIQAARLHEALDQPYSGAIVLNALGWNLTKAGRLDEAATALHSALDRADGRFPEIAGDIRDSLGVLAHRAGDLDNAVRGSGMRWPTSAPQGAPTRRQTLSNGSPRPTATAASRPRPIGLGGER